MGIVTEYLNDLIARQVDEKGLVVWYDPGSVYTNAIDSLNIPNTSIIKYVGSFISLRWKIDQDDLLDGEEPPRLIVYVPKSRDECENALIELEACGITIQPGQQPPSRNTRLTVVARNALKGIMADEGVAQIEVQVEAGKINLAELDDIANRGGEITKGVLALVFDTGKPQEIALNFLDSKSFDENILKKEAIGELLSLLKQEFGYDVHEDTELDDIRISFSRYVQLTDFISGLGDYLPEQLESVSIAPTPITVKACTELAKEWRLRSDKRKSYISTALRVERDFNLDSLSFDFETLTRVETFPVIERLLLKYAENRLIEKSDGNILSHAESRLSCFWCEVEPKLQARWALVASAAEVLLEAERVEKSIKKDKMSFSEIIDEYTVHTNPWCLLDTHHRHLESRWFNFDAHGDNYDSTEKLVIKARRRYSEIGSLIAKKFVVQLNEGIKAKKILKQRDIFEKQVKPLLGKSKIAYVWVDAFRYEMGRELSRLLAENFDVEFYPALASVPTVTEVGMTSLLPRSLTNENIVSVGSGKLAMEIDGDVIKDRKDRIAFLKKRLDVEVYETKLENLIPKPTKKIREGIEHGRLIIVTSQEIDELCEQDNITQARRQMDGVVNDLRRGIRILSELGVERIIVTADHGHIFAEELSEDMKIESPGGKTVDLNRRMWVGEGGTSDQAYLRVPLNIFGIQSKYDFATPFTFACFKSRGGGKAYFHGGLSPQELLIPVMTLSPKADTSVGLPTNIVWTLTPGSEKLTTRFFSVQIEGMNEGLFDIVPPRIRVELRAKTKVISRAISASYGFEEATGDVALRLDPEDSKKIEPNTVTLMITEEPEQKKVSLYLFNAETGVELKRLEKIEVSISM